MSNRKRFFRNPLLVAIVPSTLGAFGGCSAGEDSTLGLSHQSAIESYSVSFQQGINGYSGVQDAQLSASSPTSNYRTTTILLSDGDDPYGSGKDVSTVMRSARTTAALRQCGADISRGFAPRPATTIT